VGAQADALAFGTGDADVPSWRRHEGNRPSSILTFRQFGPRDLGRLMALYEHPNPQVRYLAAFITKDIEPQETMTNDNVPVKVRAVVWYKVVNPENAIIRVTNYPDAVRQTALTSLRSVMGQHSLDELLKEQEKLSVMLGEIIDKVTEPWGVAVDRVQIKDVEIPQSMQRAMAQEAEAHREKRARIIKAEAEYEAAMKLTEAANRMAQTPMAIELRRMQMLTEVGAEQNTMTIVMMPSEFVTAASALTRLANSAADAAKRAEPV